MRGSAHDHDPNANRRLRALHCLLAPACSGSPPGRAHRQIIPPALRIASRCVARADEGDCTPVICSLARTPFGRYRGALRNIVATQLGALAAAEALRRVGVESAARCVVDEVIFGQVLQAGVGQAPARQVALGAGLPHSTPCTTVNKVCGSSLKAVMLAASAIRARESEVVLCGGMESMSNAPLLVVDEQHAQNSEPRSTMLHDGLTDPWSGESMGETGEVCAQQHGVSRADADAFAARSHTRAHAAWESGVLGWECFPVAVQDQGGVDRLLERDEGIRINIDAARLAKLSPSFAERGQVTAGNASQLSDGAAAILVASRAAARHHGWPILATLLDQSSAALAPLAVMSAPIGAVRTLLERNGLAATDLHILEHNEAFAVASCAVARALGVDETSARFNPNGG
eukprot:SAG11_NODE_200_length_12606_cov_51.874550_10_plen_403_part_00